MNYPQEDKDKMLTVTLRAADWRKLCYALSKYIEDRRIDGFEDIAERYQNTRNEVFKQLNIEFTSDLPVDVWR